MESWNLSTVLEEHDFSDGSTVVVGNAYDLTHAGDDSLFDKDASDAWFLVQELGLSHDVTATHYSRVIDGDVIAECVNVVWEFWVNDDAQK